MYEITSTHTITGQTHTGTANTIPAALAVFTAQLREVLPTGKAQWAVTDPAGREHPGIITLNGRQDLLESAIGELCDDLYVQLHRSADGYPESITTGTAPAAAATVIR